jgi:hypothetical protein
LVTTISASALTVSVGVSALASKLENLYFVSKRTGAAASSLKAFDFAARNLGISTETAFGAVESLAKFLRNNPAGEGYLATLGVRRAMPMASCATRSTSCPTSARNWPRSRPGWQASTATLGIDENLLLAMRDGDFAKFMQQYREMSRNNGLDKAAEDAHRSWSRCAAGHDVREFRHQGRGRAAAQGRAAARSVQRWFEDHSDEIADVSQTSRAPSWSPPALGPPLSWLVDQFIELDKATDGWSTKILLLVGAFGALGGFKIVSGIWKMVAAVRALGAANAAAALPLVLACGRCWGRSCGAGGWLAARLPFLADGRRWLRSTAAA